MTDVEDTKHNQVYYITDEMMENTIVTIQADYIAETYKRKAKSEYLKDQKQVVLVEQMEIIRKQEAVNGNKITNIIAEGMAKKTKEYQEILKKYLTADKEFNTMDRNIKLANTIIDLYRTEQSGRRSA